MDKDICERRLMCLADDDSEAASSERYILETIMMLWSGYENTKNVLFLWEIYRHSRIICDNIPQLFIEYLDGSAERLADLMYGREPRKEKRGIVSECARVFQLDAMGQGGALGVAMTRWRKEVTKTIFDQEGKPSSREEKIAETQKRLKHIFPNESINFEKVERWLKEF